MSKLDKAKERILSKPKDYTYTEARYLLSKLGFKEFNKGKTSGSIHKPHPEDEMDAGAVKDLVGFLKELGEV